MYQLLSAIKRFNLVYACICQKVKTNLSKTIQNCVTICRLYINQ